MFVVDDLESHITSKRCNAGIAPDDRMVSIISRDSDKLTEPFLSSQFPRLMRLVRTFISGRPILWLGGASWAVSLLQAWQPRIQKVLPKSKNELSKLVASYLKVKTTEEKRWDQDVDDATQHAERCAATCAAANRRGATPKGRVKRWLDTGYEAYQRCVDEFARGRGAPGAAATECEAKGNDACTQACMGLR